MAVTIPRLLVFSLKHLVHTGKESVILDLKIARKGVAGQQCTEQRAIITVGRGAAERDTDDGHEQHRSKGTGRLLDHGLLEPLIAFDHLGPDSRMLLVDLRKRIVSGGQTN